MERRNSKEWINSLKIAIINNDLTKIEEYSKRDLPSFSSIDEAKEALNLVNQAISILQKEKDIIGNKLQSFKNQQKYFQNYQNSTFNFEA